MVFFQIGICISQNDKQIKTYHHYFITKSIENPVMVQMIVKQIYNSEMKFER